MNLVCEVHFPQTGRLHLPQRFFVLFLDFPVQFTWQFTNRSIGEISESDSSETLEQSFSVWISVSVGNLVLRFLYWLHPCTTQTHLSQLNQEHCKKPAAANDEKIPWYCTILPFGQQHQLHILFDYNILLIQESSSGQ